MQSETSETVVLDGVAEYSEGHDVKLVHASNGRLVVQAFNEAGCNCTQIDLIQMIEWLWNHRRGLMNQLKTYEPCCLPPVRFEDLKKEARDAERNPAGP